MKTGQLLGKYTVTILNGVRFPLHQAKPEKRVRP